ncbi:MAG: methyltransferase domain-containing protein [Chloroflexus sp.]|uniref:methyltransferase domain-containing protein n=1 Tax=Chloroflexus sp. TaxID=1904827 RepID=UPI004049DA4A
MCNATDNIFRSNTFDKILMSEFIEHISPHERRIVLENVRKWLKPGGKLLIYTFPNRWSRRTHPLMRLYLRWRTGIDIGACPDDTLHPDYSKLHLNE